MKNQFLIVILACVTFFATSCKKDCPLPVNQTQNGRGTNNNNNTNSTSQDTSCVTSFNVAAPRTIVSNFDSTINGFHVQITVTTVIRDTNFTSVCVGGTSTYTRSGVSTSSSNTGGNTTTTTTDKYVFGVTVPDAGQNNLQVGQTYWGTEDMVGTSFVPVAITITARLYSGPTPYYTYTTGASDTQWWYFTSDASGAALMSKINTNLAPYHAFVIVR